MIPLPRYVWPLKKANDRRYYYFAKFRGTAAAWPRIPLPTDPQSVEFAKRVELCQRINASKGTAGSWTWTFTDAAGRIVTVPAPTDGAAFWSAVDKAEDLGRRHLAGERKTFSALIADYKDSDAFKLTLSDGSRREYRRYLDDIERAWGDDPVADLAPEEAQKAIDSYRGTPAAARYFRAVLSRLIGWGIPRGYRTDNPIVNTEKIDSDGTYEPWADWQFELWFQHARVDLLLPAYTGLFTGQRSVDVFKMMRPPASATEMPIFAQKTQEWVPIQIHSEYRAIINAAKLPPQEDGAVVLREEDYRLHLRTDGEAWTLEGARTAWQREMTYGQVTAKKPTPKQIAAAQAEAALAPAKAAAMTRLREARTVFHGLRKNAVIMLLEVGCTEKEVEKIVGMSPDMVAHYAKRVRARHLAINAMKKLEIAWPELRKSILGNVSRTA